jgi:DNA-binding transcriptional regulator YiaG
MQKYHRRVVSLMPKTLGDDLKCKRLERKVTQEQVAAILGVSDTIVSFWEANFYEPPSGRRKRVIAFLGYDPEAPESASQQQGVTR